MKTFDIAIVPEFYTNKQKELFNQNAAYVKAEWDVRLPFLPVNFLPLFSQKTSFGCTKGGTALHGATCNAGKVWSFVNDLHPQLVQVLLQGQSGGGAAIGNQMSVVGNKSLDATMHEFGHSLGFPDGGYGIMSAAENGLYNSTFTTEQIKSIAQRIQAVTGTLDVPSPMLNISLPTNNTTVALGSTLFISAEISNCIAVDVKYFSETKTEMCWDRNPHCNKTNGVKFWLIMSNVGQHTITLKAIGINSSIEKSITVNVQ